MDITAYTATWKVIRDPKNLPILWTKFVPSYRSVAQKMSRQDFFSSKLRKSTCKTFKNYNFLAFPVIDKSFGTHLEEGLKLICPKFQGVSSKNDYVIAIFARSFIIQHTFKNNYFADLQKWEFSKPIIWALFVCPKTYFKIISSHLGWLGSVNAP